MLFARLAQGAHVARVSRTLPLFRALSSGKKVVYTSVFMGETDGGRTSTEPTTLTPRATLRPSSRTLAAMRGLDPSPWPRLSQPSSSQCVYVDARASVISQSARSAALPTPNHLPSLFPGPRRKPKPHPPRLHPVCPTPTPQPAAEAAQERQLTSGLRKCDRRRRMGRKAPCAKGEPAGMPLSGGCGTSCGSVVARGMHREESGREPPAVVRGST